MLVITEISRNLFCKILNLVVFLFLSFSTSSTSLTLWHELLARLYLFKVRRMYKYFLLNKPSFKCKTL